MALSPLAHAASPTNDTSYISRLRQAVTTYQKEISTLDPSAALAAKNAMAGGKVYFAGTQKSFTDEATARSGGLMFVRPLSKKTELQPLDTVVIGAIRTNDPAELNAILERVKAAGARAVLFSNHHRPEMADLTILPKTKYPAAPGSAPDIESVANIAGMWTWVAQFTTHCLRGGKMPRMFESVFMPGGEVRDKVLRAMEGLGTDLPAKVEVADLGTAYLQNLEKSLGKMAEVNKTSFTQAAALMKEQHAQNLQTVVVSLNHMFPMEFQSNSVPEWIIPAPKDFVPHAAFFTLSLGYQWFPWELPILTGPERLPSIIVSSRGPTPEWVADESHIYINPCWEVQDATVEIPGYDVKGFPISGIMQTTVFWTLIEKITATP